MKLFNYTVRNWYSVKVDQQDKRQDMKVSIYEAKKPIRLGPTASKKSIAGID